MAFARPKSRILTTPSGVILMLAGFGKLSVGSGNKTASLGKFTPNPDRGADLCLPIMMHVAPRWIAVGSIVLVGQTTAHCEIRHQGHQLGWRVSDC